MTINVYFIEGRKGSVCNNDAYSVVEGAQLIDIIPAAELLRKKLTVSKIVKAFKAAAKKTERSSSKIPSVEQQKAYARKALGL